jgi:hypothetical protein
MLIGAADDGALEAGVEVPGLLQLTRSAVAVRPTAVTIAGRDLTMLHIEDSQS